jgi:hypothetical protein
MSREAYRQEGQMLLQTASMLFSDFIKKRGGFLPFAVAFATDGQLSIVHLDFSDDEGEPIEQLRALLRREITDGKYRSVAVVEEVEITKPQTGQQTRAARVEIEHHAMPPITWYQPFECVGEQWHFGGATGEGYLQEGQSRFFEK